MLGPRNLQWVKNVKRDGGADWAYMEFGVGDFFDLHFPNNPLWFPTNYDKPQIDDCILIYQTYNGDELYARDSYITHIVTPVTRNSEKVAHATHPYKRNVCVVGKSDEGIRKPYNWNFFKPNRGAICRLSTLELSNGINPGLEETQDYFWGLFADINPTIDRTVLEVNNEELDNEEMVGVEGAERIMLKLHKFRERNSAMIIEKKRRARERRELVCEVCSFDFAPNYPRLGEGFIECHHKIPISLGRRITSLDDLSLVCANCHRMLHRKVNNEGYFTVDQLCALLNRS